MEEGVCWVNVTVMPHLGKESALRVCRKVIDVLVNLGVNVLISSDTVKTIGVDSIEPASDTEIRELADIAIVIGGDGAMLSAARLLSPYGIPLLGINTGHLGFLTQVEIKDIDVALDKLISNDYSVEERKMLDARVVRDKSVVSELTALNDIVLTKSALARIITLKTYISEQHVATYRADGLIIATPTGSTAYSLSAGGPIVNPSLNVIVVTPICAHTLIARAVVASGDELVRIEVDAHHNELMMTSDGQVGFRLRPGDSINISVSPYSARLANVMRRGFYDLVQKRISEGRL
jgi:NAD+ kinase